MSVRETRKRERAFEVFAERVTAALGERVHEIILYGSTARKEATERSDVDVMIVLDETNRTHQETIVGIAFDTCLEYGVDIIPNVQPRERFEARRAHPFIRTVRNQGRSYG